MSSQEKQVDIEVIPNKGRIPAVISELPLKTSHKWTLYILFKYLN